MNNSNWESLTLSAKRKKNWKISRLKITKKAINNDLANGLIEDLNRNGFWTISNDSLSDNKRIVNDSTITRFAKYDGITYKFEMLKGSQLRIIEAYEPEYFFQKIPEITTRKRFIESRDLFEKTLITNSY